MTEYYRMPAKYHNDEYDRCFYSTSNLSVMCGVKTIIKRNSKNEIWKIIEVNQISGNK